MATETDLRLRSWLDSNQRDREQMCRAILALGSRYSEVRPRHPSGGPDGGRDIEATYDGSQIVFGAVGFANGANDSAQHKKQIRKKFTADLKSALFAKPDLKVFAFLTNVHFPISDQDAMKEEARKAGIEHCDILDRERLRIELDSPGGLFIRFQYLDLPMSPAEQASFLSRYGNQIQEIVSTGFQRVEKTLNRLVFLAEANDVLNEITVRFVLKKSYPANEIGHFRSFVCLSLRAVKHDIFMIWFGASDKSNRFRDDIDASDEDEPSGIGAGIGGGQWENHIYLSKLDDKDEPAPAPEDDAIPLVPVGWSASMGTDPVPAITVHYRHDKGLVRFRPRLLLRDLDNSFFLPMLNHSLAEKLHSMQVFANGYKLADYGPGNFHIDSGKFDTNVPGKFTTEELADSWVRIRPTTASMFRLRFTETTPRRIYEYGEPRDTPWPNQKS